MSSGAALGDVSIVVITSGGASSPANFTVNPPTPTLISVSPASGIQGGSVPVTLTGANFVSGATVASSNPGVTASGVTVVSPTQLTATFTIAVNATLGTANVTVTTSGGTSAAIAFTVSPPPPALTSVSPASGVQGGSVPVTLTGANFLSGATVATSNAGITVGSVTVVSLTQITATFIVAANAAFGAANVTVTTAGGTSAPAAFTVTGAPVITSLWPTSGPVGTAVTIAGANFGATQGASTVAFNGTVAGTASSWSDTNIVVQVPGGASTGNVVVTVGGMASSGTLFTVATPPNITKVWPTLGPVGMAVTITGANFGASQGTSTVTFGGASAGTAPYWSDTSITVTVPSGAATGNVVVTVNGLSGSGGAFTVTNPPAITSLSASTGAPGDTITISGTGFGSAIGLGQVWLGSTYCGTVVSWSDTQVVATVALTSRSGKAQVLQGGAWSNEMPFQVVTVTITEVLPNSGFPGDAIVINGSGFGNIQGTGVVQLGSTAGQVLTWSDTQIMAKVAAGAVSGIARVQQGGILSNAMTFTVLGSGSTAMTMAPNLLNMVVGDMRTIQALSAAASR